jgi:hypothetical protein
MDMSGRFYAWAFLLLRKDLRVDDWVDPRADRGDEEKILINKITAIPQSPPSVLLMCPISNSLISPP